MKTSDALEALAFAYAYGLGGLESCPDDKVPTEEVSSWLAELIRKEREEAWSEGVNASDTQYEHIFNGHPVPEGEMCGECEMLSKNPYSNGSNET